MKKKLSSTWTRLFFPFITEKREERYLPDEQKAILVFDVFKAGQKTERVYDLIADNNCVSVSSFLPI